MHQRDLAVEFIIENPLEALMTKGGRPLSLGEIRTIENLLNNYRSKLDLKALHDGLVNQAILLARVSFEPVIKIAKPSSIFMSKQPDTEDATAALINIKLALLTIPDSNGPVGLIAGSLAHAGHKEIAVAMLKLLTRTRMTWVEPIELDTCTFGKASQLQAAIAKMLIKDSSWHTAAKASLRCWRNCSSNKNGFGQTLRTVSNLIAGGKLNHPLLHEIPKALNTSEKAHLLKVVDFYLDRMSYLPKNSRGYQQEENNIHSAEELRGVLLESLEGANFVQPSQKVRSFKNIKS